MLLTPSASGRSRARPCSNGWFSALKSSFASLKEFGWVLLLLSTVTVVTSRFRLDRGGVGGSDPCLRPSSACSSSLGWLRERLATPANQYL